MDRELKTAGVVGLVAAAAGAGLALGMGLRLFSLLALVGLGTGVALGVTLSARPRGVLPAPEPSDLVNAGFNPPA